MKICKVTIIDRTKENIVFEVIYKNFLGVYITRKAYRLGKHDLCRWLDRDEPILLQSSSLCTILDLGVDEFFVSPATN